MRKLASREGRYLEIFCEKSNLETWKKGQIIPIKLSSYVFLVENNGANS